MKKYNSCNVTSIHFVYNLSMKLKSKHKEMKISFGWGFSNGQVLIETKNSSLRRTEKKTKKLFSAFSEKKNS